MIGQVIENLLQKAVDELLESNDPLINEFREFCRIESIENEEMHELLSNVTAHLFMVDQDFREEELHGILKNMMSWIQQQRRAFVFKAVLNEKYIESQRLFRLPANYTVAQLAYAVMAAFKAEGRHEYYVRFDQREFVMNYSDEVSEQEELASSITLGSLSLKKGHVFSMEYDTRTHWSFIVTVDEVQEADEDFNRPELLDWDGFNLWEEGKKYLLHYRNDPNASVYDYCGEEISIRQYMEENEIDKVSIEQAGTFEDNIHMFTVKYDDECFLDDEIVWSEDFNSIRFC